MRALVLDTDRQLTLQEVPFTLLPGECTVRVLTAGICGTDLHLLAGYADFQGVPGHEFVGVVDAVSDPRDIPWIGQRVVGEINVGCGACAQCRAGVKEHCPTRTVVGIRGRGGAFAEFLSLPSANLHRVPDQLDNDTAVFVEPVAAACRILEQVPIAADTCVAVLGDGRLGLLIAQVLRTVTATVTVAGRHARKLDVARALGLDAAHVDRLTADVTQTGRFDLVVDATGRAETLTQAVALTRPRGTVVMKTTAHGEAPFTSWPAVVNEVTLIGSRCGPFARALTVLESGQVQTRPLVASAYQLDAHATAFTTARRALKALFRVS
jgi:threonine dehydrogenase-like Zn-dependent dehydrogenase